ncbi:MAG: hypothetical protein HY059_16215 [Proteobacteria bacterium]|nr:hypothetical protein [Pseudomonadota bacterium]
MSLRPRGFLAGFLAGLCCIGGLWFWFVHFRFGYEIIAVVDRTIQSVDEQARFETMIFPTSRIYIEVPPGPDGQILILRGDRSIGTSAIVELSVRKFGLPDRQSMTLRMTAPLFARHCTAVAMLQSNGSEVGPCVASETSWIR